MAIDTISAAVLASDVTSIAYTDVEYDGTTGKYVREVRVFSTNSGGTEDLIFRLRMQSSTREGIEFTTPSLSI